MHGHGVSSCGVYEEFTGYYPDIIHIISILMSVVSSTGHKGLVELFDEDIKNTRVILERHSGVRFPRIHTRARCSASVLVARCGRTPSQDRHLMVGFQSVRGLSDLRDVPGRLIDSGTSSNAQKRVITEKRIACTALACNHSL